MYYRTDRNCLCPCYDGKFQTGILQDNSPYLRIFSEHDLCSMYRIDLEHDLSQQIWNTQLVPDRNRTKRSVSGMVKQYKDRYAACYDPADLAVYRILYGYYPFCDRIDLHRYL